MDKNYDLSTRKGYEQAVGILKGLGWFVSPTLMLIYKIFTFEVPEEKQKKAAVDLIKAGKEQGLKKITIKMSQNIGADFTANIEGIPITAKVGKDNKLEVVAEY